MKAALSFRRHRIAQAVRPENRAGPAKVRVVTPGRLCRQGTTPVLTLPQPISVPLSAHATLSNRCVHDRIRAHAMPVHGHGLN